SLNYEVTGKPIIKFSFTEAINPSSVTAGIKLIDASGTNVTYTSALADADKTLTITPQNNLSSFTSYALEITSAIKPAKGGTLVNPVKISLSTGFDDTDKFPRISDEELLTLVQKQTFKYFYDFGHPVSGLARERSTSGN